MTARKPRVLLIDDQPAWRTDATDWLQGHGYAALCAGSIPEADRVLDGQPVDIIVLNVCNRVSDPWDFLLRATCESDAQVILVSGNQHMPFVVSALQSHRAPMAADGGADRLTALRHTIDQVWQSSRERRRQQAQPLPPLTQRERDLIACLADGLDNRAMAGRLAISEKTVRNLLTKLYGKLQVASRTQALLVLQQSGYLKV